MKIPIIKKMAETLSLEQLQKAEEALLEEQPTITEIEGADEGEKLTHTMAAIYIKNQMEKDNLEFSVALRNYTQRVRNSIS
jgi:hypothetical protein